MRYWAHSDREGLPPEDPSSNWQGLADHLREVSELAEMLAREAKPGDPAFHRSAALTGMLHDFGKYTQCFQNRIRTGTGRCPHSAHGAAVTHPDHPDAAFAIAGHHGGIPDPVGGNGTLKVRMDDARLEAESLRKIAVQDCPELEAFLLQPREDPPLPLPEFDLRTRMLFSCLVDADRLNSGGREPRLGPLNAEVRLHQMLQHIDQLARESTDGHVKQARSQVLADCLAAAAFPEPILSLSVPTGGGKTLAAMAFALQRAVLRPDCFRRVIVVIPFLSIIEQNAQVYSDVFGADAILEHHSGSHDSVVPKAASRGREEQHFVPAEADSTESAWLHPERQPATENWDAPLIVTTSVRFFESLFSNRPSDLRRVHNVARSIIILDEVQTLPRRLLAPLLKVIEELAETWGCTFVFSTATQPAFERKADATGNDARWKPGRLREIIRDPNALRTSLRRVTIDWEIDRSQSWAEIANRLAAHEQALCVVNTRNHAATLFALMLEKFPEDAGNFHLSTRMCAAHRLDVLATIRQRLDAGLTCRVVSTQLVEAGVDIDFPIAFRALGPLDSVIQVAGRADRAGKRTAALGEPAGRVVVFQPEDPKMPPNEYLEAAQRTGAIAREALQRGKPIQPESVEEMDAYWHRFYNEGHQGQDLQQLRETARFATLASEFEMISNRTVDVFVPWGEAVVEIDRLRARGFLTLEIRRRLQRYVVGLWPQEFDRARSILEKIGKEGEIWVAAAAAYSSVFGLRDRVEAEDLVL